MPTLDSAKFLARVTLLANVVKSFSKTDMSFSLCQSNGVTTLSCTGANANVSINSNDLIEGTQDFEFGFDQVIMTSVLSKRGKAKFKIDQGEFVFTAGNYSGKIVTVPVLPQFTDAPVAKGQSVVLPKGLFERLQGLSKVLKITTIGEDPILMYVVIENHVLKVSTFENYHSAAYTSVADKSLPDLRAAFPYAYFGYFNQLLAIKEGKDYKLRFTDSQCIISSKEITVSLPFVQSQEKDFLKVPRFFSTFDSLKPRFKAQIDPQAMASSAVNLISIYEVGCSGALKCGKQGISMSLKTAYGSLADSLPASNAQGDCTVHVNLMNLEESLGNFGPKKKTELKLFPSHYMITQKDDDGTLVHAGSLSNPSSK